MTAIEIIRKKHGTKGIEPMWLTLDVSQIVWLMKEYHRQQLKILNIPVVNGSALLSSLLNKQREIISSPIRFNGVSNDDIIKVFSEHGIKYEQPF